MRKVLSSLFIVSLSAGLINCGDKHEKKDDEVSQEETGDSCDAVTGRCPKPRPKPDPEPQPNPEPGPKDDPGQEPGPTPAPNPEPAGDCYKADKFICEVEAVIFRENNALRSQVGVGALANNPRLAFVARDWSAKQAKAGKISHDGFPGERNKVLKAEFPNAKDSINGENVAYFSGGVDTKSSEAIGKKFFDMWKGSKGHYENMVRSSFKTLGNGVFKKDDRTFYATQLFGTGSGSLVQCTGVVVDGDDKASSAYCEEVELEDLH